MQLRHVAAVLSLVCTMLVWSGCQNLCPFQLASKIEVGSPRGDAATLACCGASAYRDVTIPSIDKEEVDLTNTLFPTEPGLVDVFLTDTSCAKLFDGPYPGGAPLCQTHLGPTQNGQVSARKSMAAGTYRVFIQGYTSNASATTYLAEVGVWGRDCHASPAAPSLVR